MPDRLAELVRQRALVSEHLAWLDREIASTSASAVPVVPLAPSPALGAGPPAVPAPAPVSATDSPLVPLPAPSSEPVLPDPDAILNQYQLNPVSVKQDVRKGCLLYFAGAFVVLGLVIAILYLALSTH